MMDRERERDEPVRDVRPDGGGAERRPAYAAEEPAVVATPRRTEAVRTEVTAAPMRSAGIQAMRWGPIMAGVALSFTTIIMLSLLAIGLGIPATAEAAAGEIATVGGVVAAVIALVAFFFGGWVAGRTSGFANAVDGALSGALVPATFFLLVFIIGSVTAGAMAGVFGLPQFTVAEATAMTQTGALVSFATITIALIIGALGGMLGARSGGPAVEPYRSTTRDIQ